MNDKHYLDEVNPCSKGHTPTYRYKSTGNCVDCGKEARKRVPKEKWAEYTKNYRTTHPTVHGTRMSALVVLKEYHEKELADLSARELTTETLESQVKHQDLLDVINAALTFKRESAKRQQ